MRDLSLHGFTVYTERFEESCTGSEIVVFTSSHELPIIAISTPFVQVFKYLHKQYYLNVYGNCIVYLEIVP